MRLFRDSTLVGLVRTALVQNRDLQTAMGRIREFRAEVGVARAPLFPELTANGSVSTNQVAIGAFTPASFDAWRVTGGCGLGARFLGQDPARGRGGHARTSARRRPRQRAVVLSLVSDVATGYLSLLELDQERAISERTLASRQATLDLARHRFAQGLTSELDVRQFEAQVAVPAAALAATERLAGAAGAPAEPVAGRGPDYRSRRGGSLQQVLSAVAVPDSLPASLLARRPDVLQAERAYAAATARIGVAQAARLPTISITGSYGTQTRPPAGCSARTERSIRRWRASRFRCSRAGGWSTRLAPLGPAPSRRAPNTSRASSSRCARRATRSWASARRATRWLRRRPRRTRSARRCGWRELRYRTGIANYLEVLEAQRELFEAELALSQAQLQQLSAAVELYRALGGSWPVSRGTKR